MLTLRAMSALVTAPGVLRCREPRPCFACHPAAQSHAVLRPSVFCPDFLWLKTVVGQKNLPASPRHSQFAVGERNSTWAPPNQHPAPTTAMTTTLSFKRKKQYKKKEKVRSCKPPAQSQLLFPKDYGINTAQPHSSHLLFRFLLETVCSYVNRILSFFSFFLLK